MFSNNQILQISGSLFNIEELKEALEFALKKSGNHEDFSRTKNPAKCCFQVTKQGDYCIGWAWDKVPAGWTEFPFEYNSDVIARIIVNHLNKQDIICTETGDGSTEKGFLMKTIEFDNPNIKNHFYGIIMFSPFCCYYAK